MNADVALRGKHSTKIIAALGPPSSDAAAIGALYEAGADVFRLNFNHGTHADHQKRYEAIRALGKELGRPIAILLDLQGPKLRLGIFAAGRATLAAGQSFQLDLDPTPGDAHRIHLLHPEIFAAAKPGLDLLIDDGKVRLRVAHERPRIPILSLTPNIQVSRRLALVWGVHSVCAYDVRSTEEMVSNATAAAEMHGFSVPMLPFVIVAGAPFGVSGSTNLMRIVWPDAVCAIPGSVPAQAMEGLRAVAEAEAGLQ